MKLLINTSSNTCDSVVSDDCPSKGLLEVFVQNNPFPPTTTWSPEKGAVRTYPSVRGSAVPQFTADEVMYHTRTKRNRLLAATDYLMFPDYPLTAECRTAFAEYRKALRDFTSTPELTIHTPWPVAPAIVKE